MTDETLGWLAASFMLASFSSRRPLPLRAFAVSSNLSFIAYAADTHILPVLALHSVLLPINLWRLAQSWRGRAGAAPGSARPVLREVR